MDTFLPHNACARMAEKTNPNHVRLNARDDKRQTVSPAHGSICTADSMINALLNKAQLRRLLMRMQSFGDLQHLPQTSVLKLLISIASEHILNHPPHLRETVPKQPIP